MSLNVKLNHSNENGKFKVAGEKNMKFLHDWIKTSHSMKIKSNVLKSYVVDWQLINCEEDKR